MKDIKPVTTRVVITEVEYNTVWNVELYTADGLYASYTLTEYPRFTDFVRMYPHATVKQLWLQKS